MQEQLNLENEGGEKKDYNNLIPPSTGIKKAGTISCASIFTGFNKVLENKSLMTIVNEIRNGRFLAQVEQIRLLINQNRKDEADVLKKRLLAFTPSATFKGGRTPDLLDQYSGFIVLDLDNLSDYDLRFSKENAVKCPYTYACFISPSGRGIKILVEATNPAGQHKHAYEQVAAYYEGLLNLPIDRSGKDVTRLCFYSYDPVAYLNYNNRLFEVLAPVMGHLSTDEIEAAIAKLKPEDSTPEPGTPTKRDPNEPKGTAPDDWLIDETAQENIDHYNQYTRARAILEKRETFEVGNRHNYIYQLGCLCNSRGLPMDYAIAFTLKEFDQYETKKIYETIAGAYKYNIDEHGKFKPMATAAKKGKTEAEEAALAAMLNAPFLPERIYEKLPQLLQLGCNAFESRRERDIFLTAAISILSGCFTRFSGTYDRKTVYPGLFCFVVAPPASGKNSLSFARQLAMGIHNNMLRESTELMKQYELKNSEAKKRIDKKGGFIVSTSEPAGKEPKLKTLFIPANSSSAAIINHLEHNNGSGIICETEADTLASTLKQDWGGYSDLIRKAFHHETVSYSRRANDVYIQIETPRLAMALSGTPSQVAGLISSAEDGSFSRFVFYCFKEKPFWRDVSEEHKVNLSTHFAELAKQVERMAEYMNNTNTTFSLTTKQWETLNTTFSGWLHNTCTFVNEDAGSTVKRMGLVVYRIAMILSGIRKYETSLSNNATLADGDTIICTHDDFYTSLALAEVYLQHAMLMFDTLPKGNKGFVKRDKKVFFDSLPTGKEFHRHEANEMGAGMGLSTRTVGNYLNSYLSIGLKQLKQGVYVKE